MEGKKVLMTVLLRISYQELREKREAHEKKK